MSRPTDSFKGFLRVRRELGTLLRLSPLVLVTLLLAAMVWRSDSAAVAGLFQSSPLQTSPVASATPTPSLTLVPTATPGPTLPMPSPTFPVLATATAGPGETPATATATVPTVETPATATPTAQSPGYTPVTSPTRATATPTPDDRQRYADQDSPLWFEWGMLFDSLALFLSYLWLCCGALIFMAIPVVFVVLWVASKNRRQQEE